MHRFLQSKFRHRNEVHFFASFKQKQTEPKRDEKKASERKKKVKNRSKMVGIEQQQQPTYSTLK